MKTIPTHPNIVRKVATCLLAAIMACGIIAPAAAQASTVEGDVPLISIESATSTKRNKTAHKAYKKKLRAIYKKNQMVFNPARVQFVDITGNGVHEMFLSWWPSVYTYRGGKVVRLASAATGSSSLSFCKKKKVVTLFTPDHMGSGGTDYYKWNGKKLVRVAMKYTPSTYARQAGARASYWVRGKGSVSRKACNKYIKKLLGGAKTTTPTYKSVSF